MRGASINGKPSSYSTSSYSYNNQRLTVLKLTNLDMQRREIASSGLSFCFEVASSWSSLKKLCYSGVCRHSFFNAEAAGNRQGCCPTTRLAWA